MYRTLSCAVLALTVFTTAAEASSLASINAMSCGTDPASVSSVSTGTGATYTRGQPASFAVGADNQFPSMVKLKMVYEHDGFAEIEHCGGTVIDSRYVVTAAHCLYVEEGEKHWDRIELTMGAANLKSEGTISRVSHEAICHAGHDPYLANDIALIKLDEPLPMEVVPAKIDDFRRPSLRPGGIAISAGWPVTGPFAPETTQTGQLRKTPLSVTDVEWPGFITVTSPSGRVEGVCQGESGGPLLSNVNGQSSIAGVLSGIEPGTNDHTGEPCMKAAYEMYFTPIAAYRDWINNVMSLCSTDPDSCRGKGEKSFFLSDAGPATNTIERWAASIRTTRF